MQNVETKEVILLRYGEIHLKGKNRSFFERKLVDNIKSALSGLTFKLSFIRGRLIIAGFDNREGVLRRLGKVSGLHSYSVALCVPTDIERIKATALSLCRDSGSFRVTVNRADKTFPVNSTLFAAEVGGYILENRPRLTVSLTAPDFTVKIDIRESGDTYVFTDYHAGLGGMPVGSAGRGLLLLSGGIDSPVAGFMAAKRGLKLTALHFYSFPYTGEAAKDKVVRLASLVGGYNGAYDLVIAPFTEIQERIHELNTQYTVILMRRYMMRIASKVAAKYGCQAIVTGESLGQVASQTVESLYVTNSTVSDLVLRPLIGMDKDDIITISRKIETYETSILPYDDCCTVFVPEHPTTRPSLEKVLYYESRLNIDHLVDVAVENCEVISIVPEYN